MAMNVFGELLAPQYLGWLWHGFWVTIGLSLCVCVAATLGGFALCVARLQGRGVVQWAARVYLSVFRNTPLLVQLFFWYFGASAFLPEGFLPWLNTPRQIEVAGLALRWPSFEFIAGFFGLTLFTAAFIAEEFRAGVQGVGAGQRAAAAALGAARLVTNSGRAPSDLRDAVCTPGGMTIEGVVEIERRGVRGVMMDAVTSAARKGSVLTHAVAESLR